MGVFRSSLRKYLKNDRAQDADKIMHMGRINRAKRLRTNAKYLPREGFEIRKSYLADKDKGILRQKVEIDHTKNPMLSGNPNFMMDMMKGQVFTMLPHIFMMTFVSYVFSGSCSCRYLFLSQTRSDPCFSVVSTLRPWT